MISDRAVLNGGVIRFAHAKGERTKEGGGGGADRSRTADLWDARTGIYARTERVSEDVRLPGLEIRYAGAWSAKRRSRQRSVTSKPGRIFGSSAVGAVTRCVCGSVKTHRGRFGERELSHPKGTLRVDLDRHVLGKERIIRL